MRSVYCQLLEFMLRATFYQNGTPPLNMTFLLSLGSTENPSLVKFNACWPKLFFLDIPVPDTRTHARTHAHAHTHRHTHTHTLSFFLSFFRSFVRSFFLSFFLLKIHRITCFVWRGIPQHVHQIMCFSEFDAANVLKTRIDLL